MFFPSLQDLLEGLRNPPKLTRWQKFVRFVKYDLAMYAVISFAGSMMVVGICVTGLFVIRWLFV